MNRECELFFRSVLEVSKEVGVKTEDVAIMSGFIDVFPSEIASMLPVGAFESTINLVPGTTPITKAPYRMTPLEMSKLRHNCKSCFVKGYIRPSASPWGAPALFVKEKVRVSNYALILGN